MGEVRGLFGDVPEPGEPVASCVDCLRDLLERAEAGEVTGIIYAGVTASGMGVHGMGGLIGSYGMIGAFEVAKADVLALMQDDYE
jgi:hypothetical protein